jgi:hypothetical protein
LLGSTKKNHSPSLAGIFIATTISLVAIVNEIISPYFPVSAKFL